MDSGAKKLLCEINFFRMIKPVAYSRELQKTVIEQLDDIKLSIKARKAQCTNVVVQTLE